MPYGLIHNDSAIQRLLEAAGGVVLETLWPTRCAVCDRPGEQVLCEDCERDLLVVDAYRACPRCGAPYGIVQCTECNAIALKAAGLGALPMDTMSHAIVATEDATNIVKAYKDQDERRLVDFLSTRIAAQISPDRKRERCVVTFIPDTDKARRRRGFDHSEEIAKAVAGLSGLECASIFETPKSTDQRKLGKADRLRNMQGALKVRRDATVPSDAIIIDDICTTGATAYGAALALRDVGTHRVHVVTFAKV